MIVWIGRTGVELRETEVLDRLQVELDGVAETAADAFLRDRALGWFESVNDVLLDVDRLRTAAGGPTPGQDWLAGFERTMVYARTKGWLSEDGTHVSAHAQRKVSKPASGSESGSGH